MSRVTQETMDKLQAFFDSLDPEVKGKCALCNETLTHIVKMAEVQTGAGTATVTRELAARVNEGAAEGDVVTPRQLEGRVERVSAPLTPRSGAIKSEPENKPEKKEERGDPNYSNAWQFRSIAISQLGRIRMEDPGRVAALIEVRDYIEQQLQIKGK